MKYSGKWKKVFCSCSTFHVLRDRIMNNDLTFASKLFPLKVRLKALRDDQILLYGPWNTEHIGREVLGYQSRGNGFSLSIPRSFDRSCHSLHFCRSMNERSRHSLLFCSHQNSWCIKYDGTMNSLSHHWIGSWKQDHTFFQNILYIKGNPNIE